MDQMTWPLAPHLLPPQSARMHSPPPPGCMLSWFVTDTSADLLRGGEAKAYQFLLSLSRAGGCLLRDAARVRCQAWSRGWIPFQFYVSNSPAL